MLTIELSEEKVQPVVSIRTTTKLELLPQVIGESYMKIMSYLQELGEQPIFAPFTAYYNLDMQNLDVEMGFPVARLLPEKDDIMVREIPASKVVASMYKGPYSGMEQPYNEMAKWIGEKGYVSTGVCYEYYFNSPQEVPENELLTKIVMPVISK